MNALNTYNDYCKEWKLTVNIKKVEGCNFFQR